MFLIVLVLCTSNVTGGEFDGDPLVYCQPYQEQITWFAGADCIHLRDLMREQANAFVLMVDCFERIEPPSGLGFGTVPKK